MKPSINENEAVVAVEENGEYRECKLADFKNSPLKLVKGILKSQADDKYEVDILNKWNGLKGTISLAETFLGIPVEVQNETEVGVVNWNSDFDAEEIEVYTIDFGIKTVHKSAIKRIKSW